MLPAANGLIITVSEYRENKEYKYYITTIPVLIGFTIHQILPNIIHQITCVIYVFYYLNNLNKPNFQKQLFPRRDNISASNLSTIVGFIFGR